MINVKYSPKDWVTTNYNSIRNDERESTNNIAESQNHMLKSATGPGTQSFHSACDVVKTVKEQGMLNKRALENHGVLPQHQRRAIRIRDMLISEIAIKVALIRPYVGKSNDEFVQKQALLMDYAFQMP